MSPLPHVAANPPGDIPAVLEKDRQDVARALRAAEAHWRRNERDHAVAWLRRGADAANLAGEHVRAQMLARAATSLAQAAERRPYSSIQQVAPKGRAAVRADAFDSAPAAEGFEDEEVPTQPANDRVAKLLDALGSPPPMRCVPPSGSRDRAIDAARVTAPEVHLDLDTVSELADLPDDARAVLAGGAQVTVLDAGEAVPSFALALVLAGDFEPRAHGRDNGPLRLAAGSILRSVPSRGKPVVMTLVCASEAGVVAVWRSPELSSALRGCPWVEDALRASSDVVHAAVGASLGPLGDALDAAVLARASVRPLLAGDMLGAVEGDVVVGCGTLRVGVHTLNPGDLVAHDAVEAAVAGDDGAVILALA